MNSNDTPSEKRRWLERSLERWVLRLAVAAPATLPTPSNPSAVETARGNHEVCNIGYVNHISHNLTIW